VRYDILGRLWFITNLNVTEVSNRVKDNWSRFCGNSGLTANVANDRALMKNCNRNHSEHVKYHLILTVTYNVFLCMVCSE